MGMYCKRQTTEDLHQVSTFKVLIIQQYIVVVIVNQLWESIHDMYLDDVAHIPYYDTVYYYNMKILILRPIANYMALDRSDQWPNYQAWFDRRLDSICRWFCVLQKALLALGST